MIRIKLGSSNLWFHGTESIFESETTIRRHHTPEKFFNSMVSLNIILMNFQPLLRGVSSKKRIPDVTDKALVRFDRLVGWMDLIDFCSE